MSGQIRMTPDELRNDAREYGASAQTIEDVLQRLTNLQETLRSQWEGKAFGAFDEQFNQLKPKVTEFAELMNQINDQLNKTADAVEQHDQELSQNFGFQ
ncbi:WXG100 family type VII secretion target [Listeria costaricensis]|uniref:WXG100 family type VII secretion target n=1 Tax=Listeria costaricensis TaxID=2026604 RepID=UPI000C080FCA|nr:WXG100 family type VII secretion target [Listeria costaricensis]